MRVERQVFIWSLAFLALVVFLALLRDAVLPFVLGIVLAYALNPLVNFVMRIGLPRIAASAFVLLFGLGCIAIAMVIVVPLVLEQVQKLALGLPEHLRQLRHVVDEIARQRLGERYPEFAGTIDRAMASISGSWGTIAGSAANQVIAQLRTVVSVISLLLVTPLVAFYILVDWEPMLSKIDGWLPREHAPTLRRLGSEINDAISAFIRGQGVVCLILAFYYATSLQIVGLQYGLLIGLVTGISSFVPFVGWALGLIVSMALALAQFWPATNPLMMVAAVFLIGQALDAAILSPGIVGSKIGLHPVWLLFALVVFSSLFGFVGVLVAVPVAAAVAVLVRFGLNAYLDSDLYKGATH